jgi:hypothetical protein
MLLFFSHEVMRFLDPFVVWQNVQEASQYFLTLNALGIEVVPRIQSIQKAQCHVLQEYNRIVQLERARAQQPIAFQFHDVRVVLLHRSHRGTTLRGPWRQKTHVAIRRRAVNAVRPYLLGNARRIMKQIAKTSGKRKHRKDDELL